MKDYDSALLYAKKVKEGITGQIDFKPTFPLAKVYFKTKNYKKAKENIDSAIISYFKYTRGDFPDTAFFHIAYQIDTAASNYKEALKNYTIYKKQIDKLNGEELSKQLLSNEFNDAIEKRQEEQETKDDIANAEKRKQRIVLILVSCFLLLVAILAAFIFKNLRKTQKQKIIIDEQKHVIEERHKEITDSINYAERIQRSFLATKENLDANLNVSSLRGGTTKQSTTINEIATPAARNDEDNYFIFFKPKDVVSGDFYWSATLNNKHFALATADSTGHGVPGAIMSLLNITSLEKAAEHNINEPSKILDYTRKEIITRLKKDGSPEGGKDGMDCSLCVYDFKNLKLYISSANNPVWIIRGVEVIEIKPDKMPVGKHDRDTIPFTQHEIHLQKGDVVYTLTDGFPDQFGGEKGKKYMSKNLRELLVKNAHLPMNEQKVMLETTFSQWIGTLEQVDDVTVIGIRI